MCGHADLAVSTVTRSMTRYVSCRLCKRKMAWSGGVLHDGQPPGPPRNVLLTWYLTAGLYVITVTVMLFCGPDKILLGHLQFTGTEAQATQPPIEYECIQAAVCGIYAKNTKSGGRELILLSDTSYPTVRSLTTYVSTHSIHHSISRHDSLAHLALQPHAITRRHSRRPVCFLLQVQRSLALGLHVPTVPPRRGCSISCDEGRVVVGLPEQ